MREQTVYISYLILTPNFKNPYFSEGHEGLIKTLRKIFCKWHLFFQSHGIKYSLGLSINRKKETDFLFIKGPKISKKDEIVDFSIFLPDEIKNLNHYIDLVFDGIGEVLSKYKVDQSHILEMKEECKKELGL
jgi:hypothetical protein